MFSLRYNKRGKESLFVSRGYPRNRIRLYFCYLAPRDKTGKVTKVFDIELIADDEVNDDVFIFYVKSEEQKNLVIKIYDEEGYEMKDSTLKKSPKSSN